MPRALDKARRELRPGAWLASLEFALPGVEPAARLDAVPGRPLWLYRAPLAGGRGGDGRAVTARNELTRSLVEMGSFHI